MDSETGQEDLTTYRTYSLRVAELCGLLKWNNFDHPIKKLEKMLAVRCNLCILVGVRAEKGWKCGFANQIKEGNFQVIQF